MAQAEVVISERCKAERKRKAFRHQAARFRIRIGNDWTVSGAAQLEYLGHCALDSNRLDDLFERCIRHDECSRKPHVRCWRIDPALRDVGHDRRHQRIAERRGDLFGQCPDAGVVLAQHHVRPVLLGAADRNESRRLVGLDRVA